MIAQYTQAAMVAENRRLAAPARVDSLPTSAMQEDHVSMGWGAARKLRTVVANLRRILAVELTCAARGLDLRAPLAPGAGHRRRARRRCARGRRGRRARTAGCRPSWPRSKRCSPTARCSRRSRPRSGSSNEWPARGPRPARHRAHLPRLAAGGGAADADEQPRPRRRRAPRRPRRLRRHRARGALLGGLRRDRPRRCARSPTTRRCSSSRASRSASFAPTSGRRGC